MEFIFVGGPFSSFMPTILIVSILSTYGKRAELTHFPIQFAGVVLAQVSSLQFVTMGSSSRSFVAPDTDHIPIPKRVTCNHLHYNFLSISHRMSRGERASDAHVAFKVQRLTPMIRSTITLPPNHYILKISPFSSPSSAYLHRWPLDCPMLGWTLQKGLLPNMAHMLYCMV